MTTIRVVAAVVDTTKLTLYREDGATFDIAQGDPRLRRIVEEITPLVSQGLIATVDISEENIYNEYEKKSGGLTRFFRVAKKFVAHIFEPETLVEPQIIGNFSQPEATPVVAKTIAAVNEIIANSKPVSDKDFIESQTKSDETIIAVQNNKIVPGMENLKGQFAYANKMSSTKGLDAFIGKLTKVIDKRGHSIQDLLKFLEKGDLPISDDGCFIAYKRLQSTSEKDVFVDVHSHQVKQRVGSYVCMDEKLVDPDNRTLCSTGLHIARRDYLGSFSGDVYVLCKIEPEAAIAVGHNEPSKIRVAGYHILAQIPANAISELNSNKAMTSSTEAQKLLGRVLRGDHIGRIEEVCIGGPKGTNLTITPLDNVAATKIKTIEPYEEPETIEAMDGEVLVDKPVDPKGVASKVTEAKAGTPLTPRELFNNKLYNELFTIKSKKKVGWAKLGFTEAEVNTIMGNTPLGSSVAPPAKTKIQPEKKVATPKASAKPVTKEKAKPNLKVEVPAEVKKPTPKKKPIKKAEPKKETKLAYTPDKPEADMTREEKARHYYNIATQNLDKSGWTHLWILKKTAKKTFAALGFNSGEETRIHTNKPDHV